MLHERNDEVKQYFNEGDEVALFDSPAELVAKVRQYLRDDIERRRIAEGGLRRSLESDYSIDRRMREACEWMASKLA